MKHTLSIGIGAILLLAVALSFSYLTATRPVGASSILGQEYQATSTAANAMFGAITASTRLRSGSGALGSVIITGANAGIVNFYNATTTNVNLRTGNKATSTILIASFPASTAAGTYVFDAAFSDGLYMDLVAGGSMPTSTITWHTY